MQIEIVRPDDFHVHFRQGRDLKYYVEQTAKHFGRALVMPNTQPAIRDVALLTKYIQDIEKSLKALGLEKKFSPLMSFKIYRTQTHDDVVAMKEAGAIAAKLYPQGVTTFADDGVSSVEDIFSICETLQELDMVLCIHGEEPEGFILDREKEFLKSLDRLINKFPHLRIVLEHVSTKEAVDYIKSHASPKLAATITVHHLIYDLNALLGGLLNPHFFCKPVLKTPRDTRALQETVLSSHPSFFLGTDSAPHKRETKECLGGCAGIFSSPVALSILAGFFSTHGYLNTPPSTEVWREALEKFTSRFGADFYKLPYNSDRITLQQKPWEVPKEIHGVVPLLAGDMLDWSVVEK